MMTTDERSAFLLGVHDRAVEMYGAERADQWAPSYDNWARWPERVARGLGTPRAIVVAWFGLEDRTMSDKEVRVHWSAIMRELGLVVPRGVDVMWWRKSQDGTKTKRKPALDADGRDPLGERVGASLPGGLSAIERWRELRVWCPRRHDWVPVGRVQVWELR